MLMKEAKIVSQEELRWKKTAVASLPGERPVRDEEDGAIGGEGVIEGGPPGAAMPLRGQR